MNASISALLSAEQSKRFEELSGDGRSRRQRTDRPGTVWVLVDDEPELKRVRVGLADDQFTELVGGLEEGDSVIVRASRLASK
jgi:multidrug efflux pump subunit AcrA (membrane-fusion protein)